MPKILQYTKEFKDQEVKSLTARSCLLSFAPIPGNPD